jgi:catechol 2,3-dioxygenase-like lactoylglutathione lyase family enzyme
MFSHVMVGSNDLERAKRFYDALFAAMGGKPGRADPKGRLVYLHNGATFLVTTPINSEPAHHANGGTIGFTLANEAAVEAWHKAGTEAGGQPIEDPPGPRPMPFGALYLAYLRDPDGNKLCGVYRMAE